MAKKPETTEPKPPNKWKIKAQAKELSKLAELRLDLIPMEERLDWIFNKVSIDNDALADQLALYLVKYPEARKSFLTKHQDFRESLVAKILGE